MIWLLGNYICSCSCVRSRDRFEVFDKIDVDQDGAISIAQYAEFIVRTKGRVPTAREWAQFHFVDYDNDGWITRNDVLAYDTEMRFLG